MTENKRKSLRAWLCGDIAPGDWRILRRFLWLTFAWAVAFLGGTLLISGEIVSTGPIAWMVAALPIVIAVFVMVEYVRYLRKTDELNRRIQLEALALAFGGAWFASAAYRLFELLGAPAVDRSGLVVLMLLLFSIGVIIGRIRYG